MTSKAKSIYWPLSLAAILFLALSIIFSPGVSAAEGRHQFMADVDGDTYYDAVTVDVKTGDWWVAKTDAGNPTFGTPSRWISGFGVGSTKQFLADVNDDFNADAVTFDVKTGDWWVAVSNGSSRFGSGGVARFMSGHGVGSANQMLGHINGDNKADAIVYFSQNGTWWGATANTDSNAFNNPGLFISGHGVGSARQFLADVDADGYADAVVYFSQNGSWWEASSDGSSRFGLGGTAQFISGHGVGSTDQFLVDVNEDFVADAVVAFPHVTQYGGAWWVALSNNTSFNTPSKWHNGFGHGVANVIAGDSYGSFANDMTTFDAINGDWWVMASDNSSFTHSSAARWITGFGVGT